MTIIILGMHRSGTSLISSILHHSGVNMGKGCGWKAKDNPEGFYEDRSFVYLNDYIFSLFKRNWINIPTMTDIQKIYSNDEIKNKIRNLLSNKSNLWGWKDPRTCITLPLYLQFINYKDVKLISVYRNHLSIAKSLHKRNNIKIEDGLKLSLNYYTRLSIHKNDYNWIPNINISYEDVINKNGECYIKQLLDFIGIKHDRKVNKLIKPELKHW